jgi:hypothetical protein
MSSRAKRRVVKSLTPICTVVVTFLLFKVAFAALIGDNLNPFADVFAARPFEQKTWLEDALCADGSNRRGGMARDILNHRLRKGWTQEEVVALLGPPDKVVERGAMVPSKFYNDEDRSAARTLVYNLGEEIGIAHGVDRAWLHVHVDSYDRCLGGCIHTP